MALVGTAVLALLSTAHAGLVCIGISAPGLERFGNFVWALAGNSGEGPENKNFGLRFNVDLLFHHNFKE